MTTNPGAQLAREIASLRREVKGISRGSQMRHRSLEGGAVQVYDKDGTYRGSIGVQPDGGTAVATVNDPVPPQPSAPILSPVPGGLEVTWDGTFLDGAPRPSAFARVAVHASTLPVYEPGPITRRATLSSAGTITVSLPFDLYFITFVVETLGSTRSARSIFAAERPGVLLTDLDLASLQEVADTAKATADQAVADALRAQRAADDAEAAAATVSGEVAAAQAAADTAATRAQEALLAAQAAGGDATAASSAAQAAQEAADEAASSAATAGTDAANADAKAAQAAATAAQALADAASAQTTANTAKANAATAQTAATNAQGTATTALNTANGKNRVVYSTDLPTSATPGTRPGDVWFRRDATTGVVVGSYEWSGTEWLLRKFGDATLDSLNVGKLTTGTLAAGVALTAGDPAADYAQLDAQGVRVFRADPAGGAPNEIVKLGERVGATDPATKRQTWNIDETGNASLRALSVTEDPLIMGRSLMGLINSTNSRMVAYGQVDRPAYPGLGTGELGVMELAFRAETGRAYAIHFEGLNVAGNVANDDVVMYVRNNGADLPLTSSPVQAGPIYDQIGAAGRFKHFGFDRFLMGYGGANGALQRVLITVARGAGGGGQLQVVACQPIAYVMDIGPNVVPTGVLNQGGAPPAGQPQNPPAVTTKDETHDALWTASYNGAGARRGDTSEAMQGYSSYDAGNGNQRSIVGFPDLTARLAASNTNIELVEISFYANHWNNYGGGTAIVGHHGNASAPGSFSGTPAQLSVSGWARQQRRTINVTQWAGQLRSGAIRGFVLGPAPSNGGEYYGRFNGAGMAEPPRIRIRYTN